MIFSGMLLYSISRFFFRASILFFYLRIFPPQNDNKLGRILIGTMVFNFIHNLFFILATVFQCRPLPYFWKQWEGEDEGGGHCGNFNNLAWAGAGTGIAFDVWMLALPLSQLMATNLPWRKKAVGSLMFFFGVGYVTSTPFPSLNSLITTND